MKRWNLLYRDDFTCQYCGDRPGTNNLQLDHIIPRAFGGSNEPENLTTSCQKCNSMKSDRVCVPNRFKSGKTNRFNNSVWKEFSGGWQIVLSEPEKGDPTTIEAFIELGNFYYRFDLWRCWENDWLTHIAEKDWATDEVYHGLCCLLDFSRQLFRNLKESKTVCA